jgi:hypothetical protein
LGAPFADWSDLLVHEDGRLVGGVNSEDWMGEPFWQGQWAKRPDLVFAGIYVPVWLESEGLWRWRMRGAAVYPTAEESQHPPISIPRFDALRLQGASVSEALAGSGAPADLVAQHAAGEQAAFAVIAAGRFDTASGPFDASTRIQMAHRAGLSDADTHTLSTANKAVGIHAGILGLAAPAPRMKASTAVLTQAKSVGLTRAPTFPRVTLRSSSSPFVEGAKTGVSGLILAAAGAALAPAGFRVVGAAIGFGAGVVLRTFVT